MKILYTKNVTMQVQAIDEFCRNCPMLEIESSRVVEREDTDDGPTLRAHQKLFCKNSEKCREILEPRIGEEEE